MRFTFAFSLCAWSRWYGSVFAFRSHLHITMRIIWSLWFSTRSCSQLWWSTRQWFSSRKMLLPAGLVFPRFQDSGSLSLFARSSLVCTFSLLFRSVAVWPGASAALFVSPFDKTARLACVKQFNKRHLRKLQWDELGIKNTKTRLKRAKKQTPASFV